MVDHGFVRIALIVLVLEEEYDGATKVSILRCGFSEKGQILGMPKV